MSFDEEFSLVMEGSNENTLEGIKGLIKNYKKRHEQLLVEQKELSASTEVRQKFAKDFKQRTDKLNKSLKKDQLSHEEQIAKEKIKLEQMKQEEAELMKELQRMEEELKEEKATSNNLKQQTDVFSAVPERKVVFTGLTGTPSKTPTFEMEPHVVYPMEGGTALITFEEAVVAKKILDMVKHQVDLGGECSITVETRPVQLMVPKVVEINSQVCPQRILISNLPEMDRESLLDKLEIHFSKTRHGGGEVEGREMLSDSGHVVLTFKENNIAKGLTDTVSHEVKLLSKKSDKVRVTPFINGKISNLKTDMCVCCRTVLVTGIPAVMEMETLQDMLEIHFQKSSHGGGEIEAILYNPLGQNTSALFKGAEE